MMTEWSNIKFKIQLEAFTKNGLSDKIVDVIKTVGQPSSIKYGKREGNITVFETAVLVYKKDGKDEGD